MVEFRILFRMFGFSVTSNFLIAIFDTFIFGTLDGVTKHNMLNIKGRYKRTPDSCHNRENANMCLGTSVAEDIR